MKANEFVKNFGVERAKQIVNADHSVHALVFATTKVSLLDLKRLIESHELVKACGGIEAVNQHLKEGNVFRFEEKPLMRQTIADVESCLEADKKLEGL